MRRESMRSLGMALVIGTGALALAAGDRESPRMTAPSPNSTYRIDPSRPRQHDDGRIQHHGRMFDSWEAWREANPGRDHRCGTQAPDVPPGGDGIAGVGDCSMTSTNPTDDYDPSQEDLVIPIVVHVIANDDGDLGGIEYSTILRQIEILNDDFNGIGVESDSSSADSRIRFVLAPTDPDGTPSIGVTWSNNSSWFNDQDAYWEDLAWDPTRYLNVYTTTAGGAFGYVPFFPAAGPVGDSSDRVVIAWNAFGEGGVATSPKDLGRTLTHEVGHYLGLLHTFEGGCGVGSCLESGDLICDTSPQSVPTTTCWGLSCGSLDPVRNFMNYSWEICMGGFTEQQVRRMRCSLQTYRPELARRSEPCNHGCSTDFNGDGEVNGEDLGIMLGRIGDSSDTMLLCADLNQNGTVGVEDFGIFLSSWGDCPIDPCQDVAECEAGECSFAYCVDGECRTQAIPFCENCGDPKAGSCYESTGTPGCDDYGCCVVICNVDPFCSFNWDTACAELAQSGEFPECGG